MADGTIFEKLGKPTAVIVTTPFIRAGDAMAKRQGFPGYRYATMPNPIGNLNSDQIKQRAREVLPQVLAILGLPEDSVK